MECTYLYGIIASKQERDDFDIAGVDGISLVRTVARNGLACVVSDYRGEALTTLSKENLVRGLLAHQRVVERVMESHAVLPAKFGTLLAGPGEVEALLFQGRQSFAYAVTFVQDKAEMEVAATWDTSHVLRELSGVREVLRARETLPGEGEECTLERRVRLGQVVKACMDQRRESYRERMLEVLKPLAVDAVCNALLTDAMVMNVAFLVEKPLLRRFEERVRHLDELFVNAITFRVIGPLPPYSFSTVEVTRLSWQGIEEARQTLRLGDTVSEETVRRAYRRLAAEAHREAPADKAPVLAQSARLWQASEALLSYCRARNGTHRREDGTGKTSHSWDTLFSIDISRAQSQEIEPSRFGNLVGIGAGR